jgi:hypothetical protein
LICFISFSIIIFDLALLIYQVYILLRLENFTAARKIIGVFFCYLLRLEIFTAAITVIKCLHILNNVDATASSYSQCPRRGRSTHIDENRTSMKTNITGSPPPAHGYSPNVTPDTPPSIRNQSDAAGDVPLRFAISHRQSALVGVSQHRSQQSPAVTSSHQQSPALVTGFRH